jgi:tetratricopeptide (TPR) repeat protein
MYFNLDVDLALAKRITRNSKEFVMDVMFDGLTYREIDVWGYYRRSALFNQNWNTNVLHAHHDAGADIGMEVPEYFEPDTASRPSLVHARLIQAVLKDAEGKEIAAYRKPTAYGDLVPVTGAPEEEGARPPQPKAPDKKALLRNGQELAQGGEFAKAVQALTEAQRLDPKDKTILWHRGNAYRQLGDLAKAISDFDAAIGLDPKYARAYLSRSKAYEQQGDKERAAADRDKALQLNPALGKDKDGG